MDYNTNRPTLLMPEYGRMVQKMADEAVKIEDREERQAYAEAIIGVMCGLNPLMKNVPGYQEKLWDHLAYISNYKLDVDYPCEIRKAEKETPPPIPYPGHEVSYLQYGTLIEKALTEVNTIEDDEEQAEILRGIGIRMKRCLAEFRFEQADDTRIEHDIERISQETAHADFSLNPLATIQVDYQDDTKKRKKK